MRSAARVLALAVQACCCFRDISAAVTKAVRARRGLGAAEGLFKASSFDVRHRLRICNAYPYGAAMNVRRGDTDITGADPLFYKDCGDFRLHLKPGDRIEFLVDDVDAGVFAIHELPLTNSVLLLVIHRHDAVSTAVSFQSHIFANVLNPQMALIDAYQGSRRSVARIMDAEDAARGSSRSEDLRYSSAVAVNPGVYKVGLFDEEGREEAKSDLVALNRESYVVLRVGVDAKEGPSYDEELVVFPRSSVMGLMHNHVARSGLHLAVVAVLLVALQLAL